MLFALDLAILRAHFASLAAALQPAGGLWVAWPKRSSGVATELTRTSCARFGLEAGLVDNKVCAIDATWSGLRFVGGCATGREPSRAGSAAEDADEGGRARDHRDHRDGDGDDAQLAVGRQLDARPHRVVDALPAPVAEHRRAQAERDRHDRDRRRAASGA